MTTPTSHATLEDLHRSTVSTAGPQIASRRTDGTRSGCHVRLTLSHTLRA